MNKPKVVLGMSGGVDSSVAVHLLQQAGYEVIGVHMLMIPQKYSSNSNSLDDARAVAVQFGIEFHAVDVRNEFSHIVIQQFAEAYCNGRTPNPCLLCNQQLKFRLFAEKAWALGGDFIATGHYVKIGTTANGQRLLQRAVDPRKDQSYFLSLIDPTILDRVVFPLGDYTKDQIRDIARQLGLTVANKADSQEICFIADNDYKAFLHQVLPADRFQQGEVRHRDGRLLGKHDGIQNYTIGQRKGLGIALGKPAYVVGIDALKNQVVLGDEADLLHSSLLGSDSCFFVALPLRQPVPVEAKIRYRAAAAPATLFRLNDQLVQVEFSQPQRAITPGQGVCFYQDDFVLGGAIIDRALS